MTAICGGGTSSAQSGYGEALYMVPSMVAALLNNIPTLWAVPLAGFIGAVTYELSSFCATDPPAVPTFTASDVVDLLNPYRPAEFLDAQQKFQDLVGAYAWYQVCKCDTVSTPAPPTAPAAPTGMPSINPPSVAPGYPTGQACQLTNYSLDIPGDNTNHQLGWVDLPSGATYITYDGAFTDMPSSPTPDTSATIQFRDSSGGIYGGYTVGYTGALHNQHHQEGALLPQYVQFQVSYFGGTGQPTRHIDVSVGIYCGTTPGSTGGPYPTPCPTDPFVLGLLQQILALTTIIQRQAVPFSYIFGTAHSGLSGEGHIDVQGLLGVKVQLDTYGTGVGVESGDPDEFFEAGWITWGNADGSTKREWITHSPFVSLPSVAGQYTRLGYTLGQGVTATITELVREA